MVYFKDVSPFLGSHQLIIRDDESQSVDKGTCLVVRTSIAGRYVRPWPQLTNLLYLKDWSQEVSFSKTSKAWILLAAHHQHSNELIRDQKLCSSDQGGRRLSNKDFLPTLGRRIIQEKARWGDVLQFAGESQYIKGYWEWTEDVLSRCRHKLDAAQIYDSVYASLFIPRFCKYLFHAYHLLRKSAVGDQFFRVSLEMWILFWSKKDMKYRQPPPRKEKKKTRPKSTHNPSGDFDAHQGWTTIEEAPFSKLGLDRKLRDETYLDAYLACWLCNFVLPIDDVGSIRPTTFKIASMMATGRKGLNKVSTSPRPTRVSYPFPVHFIYAWLAYYFKTHYSVPQDLRGPKMTQFSGEGGVRYFDPKKARKRIHKGDYAHWTYNMITKKQNLLFVDDGKAKELEQDYFIAIRSNYLTLRQGEHFVIESYSPHRFSHQFRYYKEVPGVLKHDFRQVNLEDGLRYWRLCTLSKSMSKVWFPNMPPNVKKFSSENYKQWWANIHGDYFDENLESLISLKPTVQAKNNDQNERANPPMVKDHDVQIVKITESLEANKKKSASHPVEKSNTDHHWKRPKRDSKTFKQTEADGDETGSNQTQAFAKKLEKEIFGINDDEESKDSQASSTKLNSYTQVAMKVSKEVVDSPKIQCIDVSIFEGKKLVLNTQKKFLQILSFDKFDISHLEERLKMLFDRAAAYDTARSASLNKAYKKILARQTKEAKDRLHETRIKENKAKEELNNLEERKRNFVQVEVREIEEEITTIENTYSLSDDVAEDLSITMKQVEVAKRRVGEFETLCLKTIFVSSLIFCAF
ncbi:hypothetical protein CDL12_13650 [Handroanthus impetiginosus]|uniref:Aminotransferase-like plant mobile domain-containing protein n=1 Tax=Handroanthus impetiginosus TaxID=429701 RepID=A0A2G9H879_9LAMI|nr:hypothetical protein CDL12_13650 [Handroanthus impetiginosus]